jgi:hypothetical protein
MSDRDHYDFFTNEVNKFHYDVLMADDVDDFIIKIKDFKYDTATDIYFTSLIELIIASMGKKIGAHSSFGNIYEINDGTYEYVIKESKVCPPEIRNKSQNHKFKIDLCDTAINGGIIISTFDTQTNRENFLIPNYLIEMIGSLILDKLTKFTHSFINTHHCFHYKHSIDKSTFIVMEKLDPVIDRLTTREDYLNFIIHISHALSVAQRCFKYVHYDLHTGNVMSRKTTRPIAIPLENGKYILTNFDYVPVIIDYSFNRFETKKYIFTPLNLYKSNDGEKTEYYNFNPYVDLIGILISSCFRFKDDPNILDLIYALIIISLGMDPSQFTDAYHREAWVKNFTQQVLIDSRDWRPKPEKLTTKPTNSDQYFWEKILTPSQFLLEITNYLTFNNIYVIDESDLSDNYTVYESVPDHMQFDINYSKYIRTFTDYEFDKISIKNTKYLGRNVRVFVDNKINLTTTKKIKDNYGWFDFLGVNNWLHYGYIDQNNNNEGYEFNFDCCRVDIRNYLQDNSIEKGIAINGAFFNIYNDFSPIGPFSFSNRNDGLIRKDNDQPFVYMQDYGVIYKTESGKINIDEYSNHGKYNDYITSGPLLVFDGEVKITDQNLANDKITVNLDGKGVEVFKWKSYDGSREKDKFHKDGIMNMHNDQVRLYPGALYHGANLNPRSALVITQDDNVIFVMVEGRDQGGPGLDLAQLAQLCKDLGAKHAINLDGGRSSQLMWKHNDKIYEAGSDDNLMNAYPVGTIISFTKTS